MRINNYQQHLRVYINLGLTLKSNSANIQPTAHMSTPTPYILAPNSNSGAQYHLRNKKIGGIELLKHFLEMNHLCLFLEPILYY